MPPQFWVLLFALSFITVPPLIREVQCSVWIQGLRQLVFYVFTAFPTICAPSFMISDTCHTVPISLVPFPPRDSSLGPPVIWKFSGTLQLKVRRDSQSVMWYKSDQAKLQALLPNLVKVNCSVTDVTEIIYQSALIMGIYICINSVRDCLEYFHLVATGCPHLQSKYAIFSVGHQRG